MLIDAPCAVQSTYLCVHFQEAVWDGHKVGCEAAIDSFGADAAYPISEVRREISTSPLHISKALPE